MWFMWWVGVSLLAVSLAGTLLVLWAAKKLERKPDANWPNWDFRKAEIEELNDRPDGPRE